MSQYNESKWEECVLARYVAAYSERNTFMWWWFCFNNTEKFIFYLFVSHSIHYLTIAISRAGSPGSTFAEFFSLLKAHFILKRPSSVSNLLDCNVYYWHNCSEGSLCFLFLSKQTQQKLYVNKQITNFMFPVDGQVSLGPLLLNCQHSAIHSPNWAAFNGQKHAISKKKKPQQLQTNH